MDGALAVPNVAALVGSVVDGALAVPSDAALVGSVVDGTLVVPPVSALLASVLDGVPSDFVVMLIGATVVLCLTGGIPMIYDTFSRNPPSFQSTITL